MGVEGHPFHSPGDKGSTAEGDGSVYIHLQHDQVGETFTSFSICYAQEVHRRANLRRKIQLY